MENNKNNVILTIIGVATLLVALIGASFAYFSATGGTATQEVGTGTLKISAVAGTVSGANIKPVDTTQMSIADKMSATDVAKLPVTINTTGTTINASYTMTLNTLGVVKNDIADVDAGDESQIKWQLLKEVSEGSYEAVTGATGDFTDVNTTDRLIHTADIPSSVSGDVTTYGGEETYYVLIWVEESGNVQDELQGLTITASVTVNAQQK